MSNKKTVAVATHKRAGHNVAAHTRKHPGSKTIARAARRPATLSEPVTQTRTTKAKAKGAHSDDALIFGALAVLSAAVAIGAYVVLYGVLSPMYPGAGAALRALVPLAVEMIFGFAAHRLIGGKRMVLASFAVLVILGCAATEIDAATTAPEVAKRERVAEALHQTVKADEVKPQAAASNEVGRKGNLQLAQNAAKALDLQAQRDADARERQKKLEANAAESPAGEGRLAIELAILGALGSSCLLPLLEGFLRARRK